MKKISVITMLVIILFINGCSKTNDYLPTAADVVTPSAISGIYATRPEVSLEITENKAEFIVIGSLSNDAKLFDEPGVTKGTISTLNITKVLSGNLKKGDKISLMEPYWYLRTGTNEITLYHWEIYGPSPSGKEYLFFLRTLESTLVPEGTFLPATDSFSRFPVPVNKIQPFSTTGETLEEPFDLFDTSDYFSIEDYVEIYKEALDKYLTA